MNGEPSLIVDRDLSVVWARAFLGVVDGSTSGSLTLAFRHSGSELLAEDAEIRKRLDISLRSRSIPTVGQTALSIVPYKQWLKAGRPSVEEFTLWYLNQLLPRLKARSTKNRRGTYFERLVAYTGCIRQNGQIEPRVINQLRYVIDFWKKALANGSRPRQSALQLACFDPAKDDNNSPLAGFPCLQQISLAYKEPGTIELNAYYPTQYLFDRGYGNYLGLSQLGQFIAHHLKVRFLGLTCFIGRPELGDGSKASHRELADFLRHRLRTTDSDNGNDTAVPVRRQP